MKRSLILTVFSFLVLAQLAWANVPQTINYQGVLRDTDTKEIVADGNYDLTFNLYNAVDATTPLWTEMFLNATSNAVPVTDGVFGVILGKTTSFSSTGVYFDEPYWLEIVDGTGTSLGRIELTAVPYAIKSRGVSGSANIFRGSGNVGIGTPNPGYPLTVEWNPTMDNITPVAIFAATGATNSVGAIRFQNTDDMVFNNFNIGITRDNAFAINYNLNISQPSDLLRITSSGDVGIGTISPSAKLDVVGDAEINGNMVASGDVSTQGTLTALGDVYSGGTITIPATMRYYSISPAAFNPPDNSTSFSRSEETIYSTMATGDAKFYAPVNLPHGAVIKEMVAAFIYNEATQPIAFDLYRMSLNSTGSDIIARCVSSGSSTAIQTVTESATTTVATVDNSSYTYVIHSYWPAPTTGPDISVRGVKIVYEVTTPLP